MKNDAHVYEIRPRKDGRGVDLISDVLPFGRLWYGEPKAISNPINYAKSSETNARINAITSKKVRESMCGAGHKAYPTVNMAPQAMFTE